MTPAAASRASALSPTTAMRAAIATGASAAAFLALAIVATRAADVAQRSPIEPDGSWRIAYQLGIIGAAACYLVGLALLSQSAVPLRVVLIPCVLIQLIPLAAPLLLSLDVYAYWDYGRLIVEHGLNPYVSAPNAAPDDPAFALMGRDWRDDTSIYGPAFAFVAAGVAAIVGNDADVAAYAWRAIGGASAVALAVFAARLGRRPAFSAAFVGWNPLLALHLAGGGHNDGLMLVLVLGALLAARAGRRELGGALWAPAAAIKPVPLVLLPLVVAEQRHRFGWRGFALGVAGVVVGASLAFGSAWLQAAAPLGQLDRASSVSVPFWIAKLGFSWRYPSAALTLAFAAVYLVLLVQAWRGRARLGLAAGLMTVSLAWLMPWYAIWSVALAAWEEDRLARLLALVLTLYLLRDAIPL
jgi:hypothetical protein